jgi:N-acetylmuramoyl-L-alanine amidase
MHGPSRFVIALVSATLAAFLIIPTAVAGADATGSDAAATIALTTPAEPARFAKSIAIKGTVAPPVAGIEVVLRRVDGAGNPLGTGVTADDGSFSIKLSLKRPSSIEAHAASLGVTSNSVDVTLQPRLSVRVGKVAAFTNATAKLTVEPAGASGTATVLVKRNGAIIQTARARIRNGKAKETIIAPGPGPYAVVVEFDAPRGYAKVTARTVGKATTRVLSVGSKGADVAGLIRKLRTLNLHVPAASSVFTASLTDAVIAFQKVEGLSRTGSMSQNDWRKLAKAKPIEATRNGPPNRIEVDKTRQILIKVRGGKVAGVLPVSTGATGNTPEGVHGIRWKAPTTTTWLGPGILYRTLTFSGNAFAIHGWKSVPTYPASHGCVRVPIWTADWLYDRSPVGETVIVHR